MRGRCYIRLFISLFPLLLSLHSLHVFAAETKRNDDPSTTRSYEWDGWDYYEILGLDRNAEYSEKEIKKAYRKQAQRWHPDKIVDNTTTKQESNDRFARIAEAYQVLSKNKHEYDSLLRRRVHTKFDGFAQTSDGGGDSDDDLFHSASRDHSDLYSNIVDYTGYFDDGYGSNTYIRTSTPDRVSEEEELLVNDYGQTIVRKITISSYFDKEDGFFQVVGQDYAARQRDMYTDEWFYHPLQLEPVVLQQGIFEFADSRTEDRLSSIHQLFMDPSALWPDVTMMKGSQMRKGPYFVKLSFNCDLISYRENVINQKEPHLVWSLRESGELPLFANAASDCRFELQGSQLFLYMASALLWVSQPDEGSEPHSNPTYVARLDADGALAVYRIQALVIQTSWLSQIWKHTILATEMSSLLSISCEMLWSVALGRRIRRTSTEGVMSETCIVAVGSPAGCLRIGRKLVQLFRNAKALGEQLISIVGRLLDTI